MKKKYSSKELNSLERYLETLSRREFQEYRKVSRIKEDIELAIRDGEFNKAIELTEELNCLNVPYEFTRTVQRILLQDKGEESSQHGEVQHLVLGKQDSNGRNRVESWFKRE